MFPRPPVARCDPLIVEHHYLHELTLAAEHLRYALVCQGQRLVVPGPEPRLETRWRRLLPAAPWAILHRRTPQTEQLFTSKEQSLFEAGKAPVNYRENVSFSHRPFPLFSLRLCGSA